MRAYVLAAIVGLATPAMAQPLPPGVNPSTGARPGNDVGTGESLPTSSGASNINPGDTRSDIAPRLPAPSAGDDNSSRAFLLSARSALIGGQTGAAQEALERAETRLLDRSTPQFATNQAAGGPVIAEVTAARQSLAAGDRAGAETHVDAALARLPGRRGARVAPQP